MISNKEGLGPKLKNSKKNDFFTILGQIGPIFGKNGQKWHAGVCIIYKVDTILANIRSWGYSTFFGGWCNTLNDAEYCYGYKSAAKMIFMNFQLVASFVVMDGWDFKKLLNINPSEMFLSNMSKSIHILWTIIWNYSP